MLLASSVPALAGADSGGSNQIDTSVLFYSEKQRTSVVEPMLRWTRLFSGGASISSQLTLDTMTGASPTGALPSGGIQTSTTPSGGITTSGGGEIPIKKYKDTRGALDVDWSQPFLGLFTSTLGGHVSRERDYQSVGGNAKLSVDLFHRLATVTGGIGVNRDRVFPKGGIPIGLSDGTLASGIESEPKHVTTGLVGLSRVLSRRWMVSVNASRTHENGYLTEPYKVVSLADTADLPVGQLTENRPSERIRKDVLTSSVLHLTQNVFYTSYRYYWDDWGVRSHTLDAKYRIELGSSRYLQPHLRYYAQTSANFFRTGLPQGAPLPEFATSDLRLGPLRSATAGLSYGLPVSHGEVTVRGEYIRQWGVGGSRGIGTPGTGGGEGGDDGGGESSFARIDLFPPVQIGTLVIGYTVTF